MSRPQPAPSAARPAALPAPAAATRSGALRGHLAMLAFSALIAGSFSLGAQMANLVSPVAFSALRFLLAASFVGAAALAGGAFRPADARAP